jgi:RNA polymerase sigma-70 factor (sigma-E family)
MMHGSAVRWNLAGPSPIDTIERRTRTVPTLGGEAEDVRQTAVRHLRGLPDAFTDAVADHHGELARFAFRLCGDPVLAEDIVAEAYARVWPHWRRGRVEAPLPYLMRTVANEAYARHRRRRLERTTEPLAAPAVEATFEARVDEHDELWAALDRLPHQQRVVLVLRVVEDLSEEETAAMLGVPRGTVKSRLSRGLDALRVLVEGSHV